VRWRLAQTLENLEQETASLLARMKDRRPRVFADKP
jgi:hypothetical protein